MKPQPSHLSSLLANIKVPANAATPGGYAVMGGDPVIAALTADSRHAGPGTLFAALSGTKTDGRTFIADALAKGSAAILTDADAILPPTCSAAIIRANEPRWLLAQIAAQFFGAMPAHIAAITGTNGKTSTAQFVREIWTALGASAASIGTLGVIGAKTSIYGTLTTPDAVTLHQTLANLVTDGVTHVALEASSHGLFQYRLDGLEAEVAGFTNITRDHLDFHGTMENYYAAKARLFDVVLRARGTAVLNADTPEATDLAARSARRACRVLTYGHQGRDLKLLGITPQAHGQDLQIEVLGKKYTVPLAIVGKFQAWNALCALGLCIGHGADPDRAVAALAKLTGVHGRLQHVATHPSGAAIFVDYAHTPDALETVLNALRPHVCTASGGRLLVVFGCGGNRDKGKRPVMGSIAQRVADIAIVTDDNPRFEEPATIRAEIMAGCQSTPLVHEVGDRHEAIRTAINLLQTGDILVIAGKGHEPGQIIRNQVLPFDDGAVARTILDEIQQ
ncbi:MAG: UDP-N-acetylmuramoyl-L-alanyl-D-glutamate--2,6-diaminopimelate ligase [Alphaproteobacteria bacterium]